MMDTLSVRARAFVDETVRNAPAMGVAKLPEL